MVRKQRLPVVLTTRRCTPAAPTGASHPARTGAFAPQSSYDDLPEGLCVLRECAVGRVLSHSLSRKALQTKVPSYESCCVGIRPPVVEDDTNAYGKRSFPSLLRRRWRNCAVSAPNGCFAPSPPGRAARSAVGRVHSDSLRIRAAGEPPPSTVPSSRGTRPTDCLARPHFRAAGDRWSIYFF